jgi:hypothetical protein
VSEQRGGGATDGGRNAAPTWATRPHSRAARRGARTSVSWSSDRRKSNDRTELRSQPTLAPNRACGRHRRRQPPARPLAARAALRSSRQAAPRRRARQLRRTRSSERAAASAFPGHPSVVARAGSRGRHGHGHARPLAVRARGGACVRRAHRMQLLPGCVRVTDAHASRRCAARGGCVSDRRSPAGPRPRPPPLSGQLAGRAAAPLARAAGAAAGRPARAAGGGVAHDAWILSLVRPARHGGRSSAAAPVCRVARTPPDAPPPLLPAAQAGQQRAWLGGDRRLPVRHHGGACCACAHLCFVAHRSHRCPPPPALHSMRSCAVWCD